MRKYAEAIWPGAWEDSDLDLKEIADVMTVADAEQAELRAEIEQVRLGARTLGEIIRRQGRDVLDATGLHHLIDEDGDGDWGLVWEHLAELRPRAGAAESKVARAAEVLDPLIEGVEMDDSGEPTCHDYDRIDNGECALLADLRRVKAALDGDA